MDQRKVILFGLLFIFSAVFGQKTSPSLVDIGKRFLGKPYRANMLSVGNPEQFITSKEAFDCVTFLENCLAIRNSKGVDSLYLKALKHVRYVGDSVQYENRFHYFSDVMYSLGYPQILDESHVHVLSKDFRFLSSYLRSKKRPSINIRLLENREKILAKRPFQFTAVDDVAFLFPHIQSGDLVAFVTKNPHLDFLHTGMLVREGNAIHLLHASQDKKQVVFSSENLGEYLISHPKFIGICVFRPIFKE
jgi:hypothetical protein